MSLSDSSVAGTSLDDVFANALARQLEDQIHSLLLLPRCFLYRTSAGPIPPFCDLVRRVAPLLDQLPLDILRRQCIPWQLTHALFVCKRTWAPLPSDELSGGGSLCILPLPSQSLLLSTRILLETALDDWEFDANGPYFWMDVYVSGESALRRQTDHLLGELRRTYPLGRIVLGYLRECLRILSSNMRGFPLWLIEWTGFPPAVLRVLDDSRVQLLLPCEDRSSWKEAGDYAKRYLQLLDDHEDYDTSDYLRNWFGERSMEDILHPPRREVQAIRPMLARRAAQPPPLDKWADGNLSQGEVLSLSEVLAAEYHVFRQYLLTEDRGEVLRSFDSHLISLHRDDEYPYRPHIFAGEDLGLDRERRGGEVDAGFDPDELLPLFGAG